MSRGLWDYKDQNLQQEIFGWPTTTTEQAMKKNPLQDKELSGILFDLFKVMYSYDGYACGDTSESDYRETANAFKDKWLKKEASDRIRYVVDTSLKDLREELLLTFGVDERTTN